MAKNVSTQHEFINPDGLSLFQKRLHATFHISGVQPAVFDGLEALACL